MASRFRIVDHEARTLAQRLIMSARYGTLAVYHPQTGFPFASRVLVSALDNGTLVLLVSRLSVHTSAMLADARVSLLLGEPEPGDPLASPRLTLLCMSEPVDRSTVSYPALRTLFLAQHPASQLYIDFPDFMFFQLTSQSGHLIAGFGQAYHLEISDLAI